MKKCTICGDAVLARGFCRKHYKRFMAHGDPNVKLHMTDEPFEERYTVDEVTGCWVWKAGKDSNNYGTYKNKRAHRVSYEMKYGPIPKGLCACHKCDNPPCVNPDHIFLGTHEENMEDMKRKGRGKGFAGEDNPGAKLTAKQVIFIYESNLRQVDLALMFKVDRNTINKIKIHDIWRPVTEGLKRGAAFTNITQEMKAAIAADSRTQTEIAKQYKIEQGTVSAIQRAAGVYRGKGQHLKKRTQK